MIHQLRICASRAIQMFVSVKVNISIILSSFLVISILLKVLVIVISSK